MTEYRCKYCDALLLKAAFTGAIEIKCRHVSCGMLNLFKVDRLVAAAV